MQELEKYIRIAAKLDLNDSKLAAENFIKGIFNIVYGLNLINMNTIQEDYPAIDLGDERSGHCYQVTFENRMNKISKTKSTYERHNLREKFPILKIFIYGSKPKGRDYDSSVFYLDDLLKDIKVLPIEKKKELANFIKDNLSFSTPAEWNQVRVKRKDDEIKLIKRIVSFCTSEQNSFFKDSDIKPYPEEKFELRFNDYKRVIEESYADLFPIFYPSLIEAKDKIIDEGNSGIVKAFLRNKSRQILYQSENGRDALEEMISYIKQEIDIDCNDGVVRFYILSELMECDIFPLSPEEIEKIENSRII